MKIKDLNSMVTKKLQLEAYYNSASDSVEFDDLWDYRDDRASLEGVVTKGKDSIYREYMKTRENILDELIYYAENNFKLDEREFPGLQVKFVPYISDDKKEFSVDVIFSLQGQNSDFECEVYTLNPEVLYDYIDRKVDGVSSSYEACGVVDNCIDSVTDIFIDDFRDYLEGQTRQALNQWLETNEGKNYLNM